MGANKECLRSHVCHPRLRLGGQFTCDLGHSLLLLPRCVIYYFYTRHVKYCMPCGRKTAYAFYALLGEN